MSSPARQSDFDSTRWSLVELAGGEEGSQQRIALEKLLSGYLPALRAHLIFQRRLDADKAEDLLHDFVTDKILQGNLLNRADHTKGRFRSLLLKSLNNYLVDRYRHRKSTDPMAENVQSLDELGSRNPDHPHQQTDIDVFDAVWAQTTIIAAISDLQKSCQEDDRPQIWGLFEQRLLRPLLEETPPCPYDQLLEQLGFDSAVQASNAFTTAKRRFRRALRSRVSPFTDDRTIVEAEISQLKSILANSNTLDLPLEDIAIESNIFDHRKIQRLAKLLDLRDDEPSTWSDEQHAASFQLQMALPLRTALADVSPRMTALLSLVAGENNQPIVTLGDLFEHPQPPIEILQIVKEWATQCMQKKNDDIPPRVAPVIYLAAVAAAFVKCQHRLTRSDDTDLQVTFRQALGASWITGSIRHLFQNALQRLD